MVRRGLTETRSEASELIDSGHVEVRGIPTPKASSMVEAGTAIEISGVRHVGRGYLKLEAALDEFNLDVTSMSALDAGASTGGFTECLLDRGAASVIAVDVGYGQLHPRLATDPRVKVLDRTNIRYVDPKDIGTVDLVVADLSFISLCTVVTSLERLTAIGGSLVVLVKPQFEVGKGKLGKSGVVKNPDERALALAKVRECFEAAGLRHRSEVASPIRGAKGNLEYLMWFVKAK